MTKQKTWSGCIAGEYGSGDGGMVITTDYKESQMEEKITGDEESRIKFELEQVDRLHLAFPKEAHLIVDGVPQSFWIRLEAGATLLPGQDRHEVAQALYKYLSTEVNLMIETERELYEDKAPVDDIPPEQEAW